MGTRVDPSYIPKMPRHARSFGTRVLGDYRGDIPAGEALGERGERQLGCL